MPTNLLIPTWLPVKTTGEQLSYYWKKDNKTSRPSDLRERNLTDSFFIKRHFYMTEMQAKREKLSTVNL